MKGKAIKLDLTSPISFLKFNIDRAFKWMALNFKSVVKRIITLGALIFISIRFTFGRKSSHSNFSLITKPMVDIINKAFKVRQLQGLHSHSKYL